MPRRQGFLPVLLIAVVLGTFRNDLSQSCCSINVIEWIHNSIELNEALHVFSHFILKKHLI